MKKHLTKAQSKKLIEEINTKTRELLQDTANKIDRLLDDVQDNTNTEIRVEILCSRTGKRYFADVDFGHISLCPHENELELLFFTTKVFERYPKNFKK